MKMNTNAILLFVVLGASVALASPLTKDGNSTILRARGALPITQCGAGVRTPVNLIVDKCDYPPCVLRKGETYTIEVDFDVPFDTREVTVDVFGIIGGIELPWNGVRPNGCDDILVGPTCPWAMNDYWTYGVELTVLPAYPSVGLTIKWQMRDNDGHGILWCFQLPARIQ